MEVMKQLPGDHNPPSLVGLDYVNKVLLMVYPFFKIAILHTLYLDTDTKDQLIKSFQKIIKELVDALKRSHGVTPPTKSQLDRRRADQKIVDKRNREAERLAKDILSS